MNITTRREIIFILLMLVFLFVNSAAIASPAASPYLGNAYGIGKLLDLENGESTVITIDTPEGQHRFKMRRVKPYSPKCFLNGKRVTDSVCQPTGLRLFQGKLNFRSRRTFSYSGAAADLIGNTLTVRFPGRRGNRIYAATFRLPRKGTLDGELIVKLRQKPASATGFSCSVSPLKHVLGRKGDVGTTAFALSSSATLEIATDADAEFFAAHGSNTNADIQAIINAAESIYTSQIGLDFVLRSQNIFTDATSEPYTSSDPNTLLTQFTDYSEENRHLGPSDVRHLFTGKDLNGTTAGFAWIGTICKNPAQAYSLTQPTHPAINHIIFAHELGHNFSATHDDSSPVTIMASSMSVDDAQNSPSASTFSDKSKSEIEGFINQNISCLQEDEPPFMSRPEFKKLKLSKKGVLNAIIKEAGSKGCTISMMLIDSDNNRFWTLKTFTINKKEGKKGILKLQAKGIKVDPNSISSFVLRAKKSCSGFEDSTSLDSTGVVKVVTKRGKITTLQDLANKFAAKLKKKRKKKKRRRR